MFLFFAFDVDGQSFFTEVLIKFVDPPDTGSTPAPFPPLSRIRSAKHYSRLTNGNHGKTVLRVAIGQSAVIFYTSYSGKTIGG